MSKIQESVSESGDIAARYEELSSRLSSLKENKAFVEAELAARQRILKKKMDEVREAGHDPDNLAEEIRQREQVAELKLDTLEAEVEAGEKLMKPMIEGLRKD